MGRSRYFLTNTCGAHLLVWNISHVIKMYVKCWKNMSCKHQNEIKTHPSLLTLNEEQAGQCRASSLHGAQQCWGLKCVQRLKYQSKCFWVCAVRDETSKGKGHGGLHASTSPRSSLPPLQLLQPGYRASHPRWQPRAGNTEVTLPFCHSKRVPSRSTLLSLPPLTQQSRGEKKTSMIQGF